MTAFLFIPAGLGADGARRVDFDNIASLFAEEHVAPRRAPGRRVVVRMVAAALLVVLAIGDTILVTRPAALVDSLPAASAARASF